MDKELEDLFDELEKFNKRKLKNIDYGLKILDRITDFYLKKKEFEEAKKFLDRIKNIEPDYKNLHYKFALVYLSENKMNLFVRELIKELKVNPKNKDAKELLNRIEISKNFPYATILFSLIIIFTFYFVNQFHKISILELFKYGYYNGASFWNLITSIFIHYTWFHFLVNITFLVMFGLILEKRIGTSLFAFIFLLGGMFGNYIQALFSNSFVIGASGAIFSVFGGTLILFPNLEVRILGFIKTNIVYLLSIYFAFIFVVTEFIKTISAELSHIVGFITGITIASILYQESMFNFYKWVCYYLFFYFFFVTVKFFFFLDLYEGFFSLFLTLIFGYVIKRYNYYKKESFKEVIKNKIKKGEQNGN